MSSFTIVRQNIDVKDERGFPHRVEMPGMITEFNGGTKVTMIDQVGEKHNVYINGDMPPYTAVNQWLTFALGCANKVSKQGRPYVGFSGFWQNRATQGIAQGAPQTRQVAPQASISAPPAPNYPPTPKTSDRDASICRQCAGKCASEIVAAVIRAGYRSEVDYGDLVFRVAEPLADWFLTGNKKSFATEPPHEPGEDTQPSEDDNIPF